MSQVIPALDKFIQSQKRSAHFSPKGFVSLVGAGPGDAELLTIKAYKAIQAAEVVLYDCLVDESILALIPDNCIVEYVGKRAGRHSMIQQDICQRIVYYGLQGKHVVRLKGGDPAVFARTHEETQALENAYIEYCIVPGITAASGASAYTGIPLTQRDCATSVSFMTASLQSPDQEPDWQKIVANSRKQTIVIYMGLRKLAQISQRFTAHGMPFDTPIAIVDKACTKEQTVLKGDLSSIGQQISSANLQGPALIIIGETVNHQQRISQYSYAEYMTTIMHSKAN
jgi:uroporphyrin-III C-methyltransferase